MTGRSYSQAERWAVNRQLRHAGVPTDQQVQLLADLSAELDRPVAVPATRREATVAITHLINLKRRDAR